MEERGQVEVENISVDIGCLTTNLCWSTHNVWCVNLCLRFVFDCVLLHDPPLQKKCTWPVSDKFVRSAARVAESKTVNTQTRQQKPTKKTPDTVLDSTRLTVRLQALAKMHRSVVFEAVGK